MRWRAAADANRASGEREARSARAPRLRSRNAAECLFEARSSESENQVLRECLVRPGFCDFQEVALTELVGA